MNIYSILVLKISLILICLPQISNAKQNHQCQPSSCGNILNISYPFRLTGDPPHCGDHRYELDCENNLFTVAYLHSNKYYVQAINFHNFTIRLVDPGVLLHKHNCSSMPRYSLTEYNFSFKDPYSVYNHKLDKSGNLPSLSKPIFFLTCTNPILDSPLYVDFASCVNGVFASNTRHFYVKVGELNASDVRDFCSIDLMVTTSLPVREEDKLSIGDVHSALLFGFELSWFKVQCGKSCKKEYCYLDNSNLICGGFCINSSFSPSWCGTLILWAIFSGFCRNGLYVIGLYLAVRIICGVPCTLAFLTYKFQRRHLSMFDDIEGYLRSQNNLMPIRYSYPQIKKMTKGFKGKLGEGGYGCVYKGKLRSGHLVAIKILGKSKANGQEFINEVATIGRIHHVNVVQLIGYCAERSKRALVYDFMPNGSLEKYIFPREEGTLSLSSEKMYDVSLGVARGIEYLHRGCDMQILHFDIKPHNILLDENFTPKVSDFGLAKLYPPDDSIASLTAARGTIGYMAPELFYKSIGGVSYKADVYSFGMLLLEMAGRRKNLNAFAENSSQIYFPSWVYDQINEGKDIEMGDGNEEERMVVKKMIIVALWCIQMKPIDRPSMSKVVEMLEGNVELLQMPPKPFLCPEEIPTEDGGNNIDHTELQFQLYDPVDSITSDRSV